MSMVPDNSVDVVVTSLVICLVNDLDCLLREIKRVLAPVSNSLFHSGLFVYSSVFMYACMMMMMIIITATATTSNVGAV